MRYNIAMTEAERKAKTKLGIKLFESLIEYKNTLEGGAEGGKGINKNISI